MIRVRLMEDKERSDIENFVRRIMAKQYHCDIYPLPRTVFVAEREGEVVGAIALSFSSGEAFHLEDIYKLKYDTFPGEFKREEIVQLGRLVATVANVPVALLRASIAYALEKGCRWGIGEVKPSVFRWYTRLGVKLVSLGGEMELGEVPETIMPYYLLPPPPIPVVISLAETQTVLNIKTSSSTAS